MKMIRIQLRTHTGVVLWDNLLPASMSLGELMTQLQNKLHYPSGVLPEKQSGRWLPRDKADLVVFKHIILGGPEKKPLKETISLEANGLVDGSSIWVVPEYRIYEGYSPERIPFDELMPEDKKGLAISDLFILSTLQTQQRPYALLLYRNAHTYLLPQMIEESIRLGQDRTFIIPHDAVIWNVTKSKPVNISRDQPSHIHKEIGNGDCLSIVPPIPTTDEVDRDLINEIKIPRI